MSDPIILLVELRIRPDKFDTELRELLANETVESGFPASDENIAWYYAESVANAATFGYGACTAEVVV
jgi:hypothetical protein